MIKPHLPTTQQHFQMYFATTERVYDFNIGLENIALN